MSAEFLQQLFSLEGQVAVVVGGTGVLGGAFCDGLAGAGAHVVVAGRSEERGGQRVEAIVAAGGSASFKAVDGTNRESVTALRDAIVADHGHVDILINCAGVNAATPYEEISDEDWHRILDGNLFATHLACQVFAPTMAAQGLSGAQPIPVPRSGA